MNDSHATAPSYTLVDLPAELPLFPLPGVLLLPHGQLPLNIFEPRYLAMVKAALKTDMRLIGMIQPRDPHAQDITDDAALFTTGCAGKITRFEEQKDGRYHITLSGICRFRIGRELAPDHAGYRRVRADWVPYGCDLMPADMPNLDRDRLKRLLNDYFSIHDFDCDWDKIDCAENDRLLTILSMICPFDPGEKQALLEAGCCTSRAALFLDMLEMAVRSEKLPEASLFTH